MGEKGRHCHKMLCPAKNGGENLTIFFLVRRGKLWYNDRN